MSKKAPKGKIAKALKQAEKEQDAVMLQQMLQLQAQTTVYISSAYGAPQLPKNTYSPGGFVTGPPRSSKISAEKAHEIIREQSELVTSFSDDLTDANGSLTTVRQVSNAAIFFVTDKRGQFVVFPYSDEPNSPCIFYVTLASHVAHNIQKLWSSSMGTPGKMKIVEAAREAPRLEMSQYVTALSSGADAPVLTDYINGKGAWANAIDSLTIPLTLGLDVRVTIGRPRVGHTIDVGLQFESHLSNGIFSTCTVPVPSGVTVSVYDLVIRAISAGSLASSACAWCGDPITKDYESMIEVGLTKKNFLTVVLLQHFAVCQRCIAKKVMELQRAEEYLREGAVPDF